MTTFPICHDRSPGAIHASMDARLEWMQGWKDRPGAFALDPPPAQPTGDRRAWPAADH